MEFSADIKLSDNEGKTAYDYTKNPQVRIQDNIKNLKFL